MPYHRFYRTDGGEHRKLDRNDSRARLEREKTRRKESDEEARDRDHGGKDDRFFEALRQAHCGKGRENNHCRDHDRAHHLHTDDYREAGEDCKYNAEPACQIKSHPSHTGRFCKSLVKGQREDELCVCDEPQKHHQSQCERNDEVLIGDGNYRRRAEERRANITVASARYIVEKRTHRNGTGRNNGTGGVSAHFALIARQALDDYRRNDNDGY